MEQQNSPTPKGVGLSFRRAQWGSLQGKYAPGALTDGPRGLRWFYSLLRPPMGALKENPLREWGQRVRSHPGLNLVPYWR